MMIAVARRTTMMLARMTVVVVFLFYSVIVYFFLFGYVRHRRVVCRGSRRCRRRSRGWSAVECSRRWRRRRVAQNVLLVRRLGFLVGFLFYLASLHDDQCFFLLLRLLLLILYFRCFFFFYCYFPVLFFARRFHFRFRFRSCSVLFSFLLFVFSLPERLRIHPIVLLSFPFRAFPQNIRQTFLQLSNPLPS